MGYWGGSRSWRVWPYRFEIDLEAYRVRGLVPPGTPNLYFDLWLFEDELMDHEFLDRHAGTHPEPTPDGRYGTFADGTPDDLLRWTAVQRAMLAALRSIATRLGTELDKGGGVDALRRCHQRMGALAAEHRPVWEEIVPIHHPAAVRDYAPWTAEARQRRKIRERNMQYGSGYSSG